MELYVQAAEGGLLRAQLIAADHYQRGIGVAVNDAEAFRWLSTAADSGDADTLYRLGVAYLEGRGIEQSYSDALVAFQASADNFSPEGSTALGYMVELGLDTDIDLDRASNLYSTGRYANVPVAKHNYARLEEEGTAFEASPANARELYEEAAQAGELRAAVNLALMMLQGAGGPQDIEGAFAWTKRAADGGNAAGLNNLGRMYEQGLGVAADAAEARRLYGEAAALGYELAAENLNRIGG
jgi:TPR repeat protein